MPQNIEIEKKCENCPKKFEPKRYWQKFCSVKCREIAFKARLRAIYAAGKKAIA